MMHSRDSQGVYYGEKYTAVRLSLWDSGFMYFFLSDEGTDVSELASNPEVYEMLTRKTDIDEARKQEERWAFPMVNLSVPKFSVSGSSDLKKALVAMGATDVLEAGKADFSPLTAAEGMFLSSAKHTAMVEIDENGVTAAAYTVMDLAAGMPPEEVIDFVLDRPFLFVITGFDGSLLFSGIVRNID
jgi:serine protease inhibitor